MSRLAFSLSTVAALMFVFALGGCKKTETENPSPPPPADTAEAEHKHGEEEHDRAAIEAALAKLSPEDRASAEAQKICPVSDHELGSMDKPIQVTLADDKKVWICCEGCEEDLKKDPEKYLAKLEKKE